MNKKAENSKQRILETAIRLFANNGFDGTSIRQICKEANTNICMISYYWGGKKELYQGIIDDLIEKQYEYAKTFIDFDLDLTTLKKQEQIELLMKIIDKFITFFYSKNISKELIIFLLKEQQNSLSMAKSPVFNYLKRVVARIFNENENDKNIIFKTLFILSQLNSPRILPAFSLSQLGQDDFYEEDIKIIKENIKIYINALIKESEIV